MREEVARDLSRSQQAFLNLVWPQFRHLGFGELEPVEAVTAAGFQKELDTRAGIGQWVLQDTDDGHKIIRGVASRVQWGDRAWDTFTVRMERSTGGLTEFAQRMKQLATPGAVSPHYTLQAYVTSDRTRLLSAAICLTEDLMRIVDSGDCVKRSTTDGAGTQTFCVVPWSKLPAQRCMQLHAQKEAA